MRPHIGSHYSIRDQAHLWHFARTSPRGAPPFRDKEHKGAVWMLIFFAGLVAGIICGLIVEWFR